jgi:hypothetical protein
MSQVMSMRTRRALSPAGLRFLVLLAFALSCDNDPTVTVVGQQETSPITSSQYVGVWSGQTEGLDIEVTLRKLTCVYENDLSWLCEWVGYGGYNYSSTDYGVEGQSANGVKYTWDTLLSNPDSLDIVVSDSVNENRIVIRVSPSPVGQRPDRLDGRIWGERKMSGFSADITLRR